MSKHLFPCCHFDVDLVFAVDVHVIAPVMIFAVDVVYVLVEPSLHLVRYECFLAIYQAVTAGD